MPEISGCSELSVDASNLTAGNTYYVRVARNHAPAVIDTCIAMPVPGAVCFVNQPWTFSICFRSLNILIPLDFGLEPPAISHAYHQNKGQIVDVNGNPRFDIKTYTNNSSPAVFELDTTTAFVFAKVDTIASTPDTLHRVDLILTGSNVQPPQRPFKTEKTTGYLNYFLGHVPTGVANVKGYSRTVWKDIYPNIDMQFYSNSSGAKFYFVRNPGGNPGDIVLQFNGATAVNVTVSGGLDIVTSLGTLSFEAGHAYAINPAGNIVPMPWQAKFVQVNASTVKFDIHQFPTWMPLIIQVDRGHQLASSISSDWSTFIGGTSWDKPHHIILDKVRNTYICGHTYSSNFPIQNGFDTTYAGQMDVFAMKFNQQGAPVWGTYYGGSGREKSYSLTLNSIGDLYIVGSTKSNNLPLIPPNNTFLLGSSDGFIARFNNAGTVLKFSRYFGGNNVSGGEEEVRDIVIDSLDNVFIVGMTYSNDSFPIVSKPGAYNQITTIAPDAFIAEFDSANVQVWGTYFGGNRTDNFSSVKIGANNSILISGSTASEVAASTDTGNPPCGVPNSSTYFPDCNPGGGAYFQGWPPLKAAYQSRESAIIVEFNQTGALNWSTYLGGIGHEQSSSEPFNSIAINPSNHSIFYLVGGTSMADTNYPVVATGVAYKQPSALADVTNAFIARFDSRILTWSTLFGPSHVAGANFTTSYGTYVVCDNANNVYMVGITSEKNYSGITCAPPPNPDSVFPKCVVPNIYFQPAFGGGGASNFFGDAFISAFNSNNQLIWSTFYGGNQDEIEVFAAIDTALKRIYLTGQTNSTSNFPLFDPQTGNYQQNNNAGAPDGFIARFDISSIISAIFENSNNLNNPLQIYPNPTTAILTFTLYFENKEKLEINVFNSLGAIVLQKEEIVLPGENKFNIDLSLLSKGIYFVWGRTKKAIYSTKKAIYSAKMVIQ